MIRSLSRMDGPSDRELDGPRSAPDGSPMRHRLLWNRLRASLVVTPVVVAVAALASACGPSLSGLLKPNLDMRNVVVAPGAGVGANNEPIWAHETSLFAGPEVGQSLLARHDPVKGLRVNGFREDYRWECGTPVMVTAPGLDRPYYGRLLVFGYLPDGQGQGPAGRGDYRVEVSADRLMAATDGKIAVQYESYLGWYGEVFAWIAWVSDRPLYDKSSRCYRTPDAATPPRGAPAESGTEGGRGTGAVELIP